MNTADITPDRQTFIMKFKMTVGVFKKSVVYSDGTQTDWVFLHSQYRINQRLCLKNEMSAADGQKAVDCLRTPVNDLGPADGTFVPRYVCRFYELATPRYVVI